MVNEFYKEYLLYLVGNLKEGKNKKYPNSRFWIGDKIGVVFEFEFGFENRFWIRTPIFKDFSMFFGLNDNESRWMLRTIIQELFNLKDIKILSAAHLILPKFTENFEKIV